jgi:ABC-2 type transport system permease protein
VYGRIRPMLVKEFHQLFRDPQMLRILILPPLLQVLVFGYAVTTNVRNAPTVVVDLDRTSSSRELAARFFSSAHFRLVRETADFREAEDLMNRGNAGVILRVDPGFEGALRSDRTAELQVIVDGTDSNTAAIVLSYAARITGDYSGSVRMDRMRRHPVPFPGPPSVGLASRAWFNENLESRFTFLPGIIAFIVMLVAVMLTSMAVVREREIGTLEQILVTPITPAEYILGKTLPFALVGFGEILLVATVGVLWFDLPFRGSLLLLLVSSALFLSTALGIGLLISTVSRTQQQAMMTVFLYFMPAVLLSGFLFPIANMPRTAQWLTYLNPLRYYLVILRGIFLKGTGVRVLWPQMAALLLLGGTTLAFATRRFRKTLS